jgi:hypothetical protein
MQADTAPSITQSMGINSKESKSLIFESLLSLKPDSFAEVQRLSLSDNPVIAAC